jgi:hypothetical protein
MAGYEDNTLDAETLALFANAPEKFIRKLKQDGECVVLGWKRPKNGYWKYRIGDKQIRAHRLAFECHYGSIPEGLIVRHSCDNPPCVNPMHLLVGTHKDNALDREERGRSNPRKGDNHHMSKLSEQNVKDIRASLLAGESQNSLAKKFGVRRSTIGKIANRERWAWLD